MESLVAQFSGVIRHECAKFGIRDDADLSQSDLMQEVYLQVWTKVYQFRGGEHDQQIALAFESWIRKTARSTLSNLYRNRDAQKRKPDQSIQSFDEGGQPYGRSRPHQSGPSSIFVKIEEAERLRAAMDQCLDDQTKEIVNRYVVELTFGIYLRRPKFNSTLLTGLTVLTAAIQCRWSMIGFAKSPVRVAAVLFASNWR